MTLLCICSVLFSNNSANGMGGALCVVNESVLQFSGNVVFTENLAVNGGGITLISSRLWKNTDGFVHFIANQADIGSAVALALIKESETDIHDMVFEGNIASVGGTIFWLKLPNEFEPGLQSDSLTWINNKVNMIIILPIGRGILLILTRCVSGSIWHQNSHTGCDTKHYLQLYRRKL